MKVSELIAKLTALPQDAVIKLENRQFAFMQIDEYNIAGIKPGLFDKDCFLIYPEIKQGWK